MAMIIVFLTAMIWTVATQGQTPAKAPGQQGAVSSFPRDVADAQFHRARESFLRKDYQEAASEIRRAAAFLQEEAGRAVGEAKQGLIASSQGLNKLADEVEGKAIQSSKELDKAFTRAHQALARYYQAKASESWAKKLTSEAGHDLKTAAIHLEHAWSWAGHQWERRSEEAIREAKNIGEKMEKGWNWTASEVNRGIDALKREIEMVDAFKSSQSSLIQVSETVKRPVDLTTAITEIAKQNLPAVVYIEVTESREVVNPFLPFESDPFLRRFFGTPKMPKKFKQEVQGLGSGMIIDGEGHILTNYHVAGGATKIQVGLADGSKYPAKLVGGDPKTDLAVIKIEGKGGLPHITFGDSDKVEVGEWVVAIGAPRALEKSVTQGIISAKHRRGITDPTGYEDFLQTDAPINPGNSGGPLLNLYGEVIGVNAAIASQSGGFEGIGFTIPSNMAVYVARALIAHGKVERGWVGVSIQDLTPELAKKFHADGQKGALIADVVKGGPADKAGLKKDDVIIAYRGKEVTDSSVLRDEVANTPIGAESKVTILRDGKKEDVTVKVDNLDMSTKVMGAAIKNRLGGEFRDLTDQEREKYGIDPGQGVVITSLDKTGPLKKAGFEVGDMILAVNDQPVQGVDGLVQLVTSLKPNQKISLLALDHRTGNTGSILITVR
jgi:Do/DeqQ family serine protease